VSNRAITWAFKIKMPPNAKLLLLSLADRADEEGRCFPSIADSAMRTGLSRDRIVYLNGCLEASGVMTIRKGSARKVNHYVLSIGATFEVPLKYPRQERRSTHGWTVTLTEPSYNPHSDTTVSAAPLRAAAHTTGFDEGNAALSKPITKNIRKKAEAGQQPPRAQEGTPNPQAIAAAPAEDAWPTWKMRGWASKNRVDADQVADLIIAEYGDPPPDQRNDRCEWARAFYQVAEAAAGGFADAVLALGLDLNEPDADEESAA
jgi:hypothetical protein